MNKLDIPAIFKSDADDIIKCRENAIRIHGTSNIRAAGDEVEICVRDYIHRMLPPRYYVAQGHLLDRIGNASSQLDVIISDQFSLPSLMTTKDGTRYMPIDSVFSVGEIKSAYYKSEKPIVKFSGVIKDIRENLYHPDIVNSAVKGITNHTLLKDIDYVGGNDVLNRIFFFAIFVDCGDFKFEEISSFYNETNLKYLPNIIVIMNKGLIVRAVHKNNFVGVNSYPESPQKDGEDWCYIPITIVENGSLEGNHLGYFYYLLLDHLVNSKLATPTLEHYLEKMMLVDDNLILKARTQ